MGAVCGRFVNCCDKGNIKGKIYISRIVEKLYIYGKKVNFYYKDGGQMDAFAV